MLEVPFPELYQDDDGPEDIQHETYATLEGAFREGRFHSFEFNIQDKWTIQDPNSPEARCAEQSG